MAAGEIFGFLGPNGAGKTTTIRLLMGMLRPASGSARVLGYDAWKRSTEIKRHIGHIPGDVRLYEHMRVEELLDYIDGFRASPGRLRAELLERLELAAHKKIKSLSRGNKQKVAIVLAVMHDPDILILDEPTLGLDPLMQQAFYTILLELKQRGKTVFLSSHILSEVERVCDRVGIVKDGQLIEVQAIESLRQNKIRHMDVTFAKEVKIEELSLLPQVLEVQKHDNVLRITLRGDIDAIIKELARHQVVDLTFAQPSLEDFFLSFYGPGQKNDTKSQPAKKNI